MGIGIFLSDLPRYLSRGFKTRLAPIVSSARAASIISHKWKQPFDYLPDAFVEEPKATSFCNTRALLEAYRGLIRSQRFKVL
jgi:hypothetical protein